MPEERDRHAGRDPRRVLREVFGHAGFRGMQEDVVRHVVAGRSALVLMPTGGGKSVTYQVPALCRQGVAVVVSPLIALMEDQVAQLRESGVAAAALTSNLDRGEADRILADLSAGTLEMLYVSPERLVRGDLVNRLQRVDVALFAIDEAHCVSQWGHDFRPEYRGLDFIARRFPGVPRVALTATADGPTRADVGEHLDIPDDGVFVASFDRPNIHYRVEPKNRPKQRVLDFVRNRGGETGIVYAMSRKGVEDMAAHLARNGVDALAYHAGMEAADRAAVHRRFVHDDGVVVVATVAFGMGVDRPDVRFIVHVDPPKSMENYYQETGRAGRDGLPADTLMLYAPRDVAGIRRLIDGGDAPEEVKRVQRRKLEALVAYCETARCRRRVILEHFGEASGDCGNCGTCAEPVETVDGTHEARLALSAVYRTGQRFGGGHVVDVLVGNRTKRVSRNGHDRLNVFGRGNHLDGERWHAVLRQLVTAGHLDVDVAGHGAFRLGPRDVVTPLLQGAESFPLRKDAVRTRGRVRARGKRGGSGDGRSRGMDALGGRVFERLRRERKAIADRRGVPPYAVFQDSTLREIAVRRPRDRDELAVVPGVGRSKLERYGDVVLAAVTEETCGTG